MSEFDIRLRHYTPAGAAGGILRTQSLDWASPRGDVPALKFEVSEAVAGALPDLLETAVETWDGKAWREPHNGRFFILSHQVNDLDDTGIKSLTGVALATFILTNAVLVNPGGEDREVTGSAGTFIRQALDEATARGVGKVNGRAFLQSSFTATRDSAGKAWSKNTVLDGLAFGDGDNLASILQTLTDQGILEYSFQGRTLHVYNPGTGEDRSKGSGRVTVGASCAEMPVETSMADLATHVVVRGDGASWTFPISGEGSALGRLEKTLEASGVTTEAQAASLAELYKARGTAPRKQYTVTEQAQAMEALPFTDYEVGDWVSVRRPGGWERMRATQLQIRKDTDGLIEVDTILADRMEDLIARIAKRNAAMGARQAGNGRLGGRTPARTAITRPPAYLPTPGPGPGWGDTPAPKSGFRLEDWYAGRNAYPTVAFPEITDGANNVYGFDLRGITSTITYPRDTHTNVPTRDYGELVIYSGYMHKGMFVDWDRHHTVELSPALMTGVWAATNASIAPPPLPVSWDPVTGLAVNDDYFLETSRVEVNPGMGVFTMGALYIPLKVETRWRTEKNGHVQNKGAGCFIRIPFTDYRTAGTPEVLPRLTIEGANITRCIAYGPHFAVQHGQYGNTGGAPSIVSCVLDAETGDRDEDEFFTLPSNQRGLGSELLVIPSLDGEGGVSLYGPDTGELPLAERIIPREDDTKWRTFPSYNYLQRMAVAYGRAFVMGGDGAFFAEEDGLKPVQANATLTGGVYTYFHDGYLYGVGPDMFRTWSSVRLIEEDPEEEETEGETETPPEETGT